MIQLLDLNEIKIAAKVLNCSLEDVYLKIKLPNVYDLENLSNLIISYREGFPLDYILEKICLLNLDLKITPDVLIPRPETENWLSIMGNFLSQTNAISQNLPTPLNKLEYQNSTHQKPLSQFNLHSSTKIILDIGCGSGIIGLYLSQFYEHAILTDYSRNALKIAEENAKNNIIPNTEFILSDLLSNPKLQEKLFKKEYILVSNLPYVPIANIDLAVANKVQFEPSIALYSGENGLDLFLLLVQQLLENLELKPQEILLELDPRNIFQAEQELTKLFSHTQIYTDELGQSRLLQGW